MVLLNLPIFIAGGAALIAGLLLRFGTGVLENDVLKLLDQIQVNSFSLGKLTEANTYLMIIAGAFIMFIAALGLCGAWNDIKCCLWVYIIIVMLLILMQVTVIGLWIFMRQTFDTWFKGRLITLMKDYAGPEATDDTSKGWNSLFMRAECCGVNDQYSNGGTKNDFSEIPAAWWANRGTDNIPATCCQGVTSDTISNYKGSSQCTAADPPVNFYEKGCYNRIVDLVHTFSLVVLVAIGVIFFVEVMAIVCACMMVKSNKVDVDSDSDYRKDSRFDRGREADPGRPKYVRYQY